MEIRYKLWGECESTLLTYLLYLLIFVENNCYIQEDLCQKLLEIRMKQKSLNLEEKQGGEPK